MLGVDRGLVITAQVARQMATDVAHLLGAKVAATTVAGAPGPQKGVPPGSCADLPAGQRFRHGLGGLSGQKRVSDAFGAIDQWLVTC